MRPCLTRLFAAVITKAGAMGFVGVIVIRTPRHVTALVKWSDPKNQGHDPSFRQYLHNRPMSVRYATPECSRTAGHTAGTTFRRARFDLNMLLMPSHYGVQNNVGKNDVGRMKLPRPDHSAQITTNLPNCSTRVSLGRSCGR